MCPLDLAVGAFTQEDRRAGGQQVLLCGHTGPVECTKEEVLSCLPPPPNSPRCHLHKPAPCALLRTCMCACTHAPVPELSLMFPYTMVCTLTAVPRRPVILLISLYLTARGMFQDLLAQ